MPLVETLFSEVADIRRMPGRAITRDSLADTDVLLVRSVTRVDRALLAGTPVRFVGSATIGTDHLDLPGLQAMGVQVVNAPGCNAQAVTEYVAAAVLELCRRHDRDWRTLRVGVVGAGNVGSRVAALWRDLGLSVRVCDPPLAAQGVDGLSPLEALLASDLLCFHVPLVKTGPWPSVHLLDEPLLARLQPETWLLNAGRGEVFDNAALLRRAGQAGAPRLVLDVWEGEPRPLPGLVSVAGIATPHVAGHSVEGKLRGTWQVYESFCDWAGVPTQGSFEDCLTECPVPVVTLPEPGPHALAEVMRQVLPLHEDDRLLKQACGDGAAPGTTDAASTGFDRLRRDYRLRRECTAVRIANPSCLDRWPLRDREALRRLGFRLECPS
jgi:erythronate-4-phosphate dehydrogenase